MKKALLIILVIVILAVGGYFIYTKCIKKSSGTSTSTTSVVSNLNSNCKYNDPDLCKFINGWKDNKYYTATTMATEKDGKKTKLVYKSTGDNSQMTMYEGDSENYNMITIGDYTYIKDYTDGKWTKMTSASSQSSQVDSQKSELNFNSKAENTEDKTTYKKISTEACGKYTCFKYQVIDPAAAEATEYIYFDNKEYQLRKIQVVGSDGSNSETTLDYSKVSISEPSPIKENSIPLFPGQ